MANTLPNPIYVMLEGGQYLVVRNALSVVQVNADYYDNSTYRKVVDAAMLGNPHSFVTVREPQQAADTLAVYSYPGAPVPPSSVGPAGSESLSLSYSATVEPPILKGAITTYPPSVETDSGFRVDISDLVPGQTLKVQSVLQFYDAAGGSGNLVGEVMLDQFRSWSGSAPANLN